MQKDILYVEPCEQNAQPIIDLLVEQGFNVTHVRTGRSALLTAAVLSVWSAPIYRI